jgi:hypothetical protein
MLAPAGLLVLLLLASVSVDSAVAFLGKRQLENAVAGAANDAVTVAIPDGTGDGSLQTGNDARPDAARVRGIAEEAVLHPYSGGLTVHSVDTQVDGQTVTVTATGEVRYIFAKAIPGVRHRQVVRAQSTATVRFR